MMRGLAVLRSSCIAWFLLGAVFASGASAQERVSSRVLVELAKHFDGKWVIYRGEVVGGVLKRGGYSWLNLYDGRGTVSVWCRNELLPEIRFAGDYKHRGDVLEVRGIFNRACTQHGGDMDIHAVEVRTAEKGRQVARSFDRRKFSLSVVLLLLTLLIAVLFRRRI